MLISKFERYKNLLLHALCKISMFLVTPGCKKEWGATVFG
jgi:hypothetical protein